MVEAEHGGRDAGARGLKLWLVLVRLVGTVLLVLGVVILLFPALGAPLFAMADVDASDVVYLRAISFRDIAVGLMLLALSGISIKGTVAACAALAVVPAGDLVLVGWNDGGVLALLPHGLSLLALAVLAVSGGIMLRAR